MEILTFILLLLAVVCFAAAALGLEASRVSLVALGLALWALTVLIHVGQHL